MKTLILMRHAKSDWSFDLGDHERPLNPRGKRAATMIGDWLRNRAHLPDEVLCSTAVRTRQTLSLLGVQGETRLDKALYLASPEQMLAALRGATGDRVLMLGHNPGSAALAVSLLRTPPAHARFDAYPTCATLVATFEIDTWSDLSAASGTVVDFIVPRDLAD
jgi:phosphohistidine phosphatase